MVRRAAKGITFPPAGTGSRRVDAGENYKENRSGRPSEKRLGVLMAIWGVIFSFATISRLAVAFDYDDTLVFSTPAYEKAYAETAQPFTAQFWTVVNQSYDLEKPKLARLRGGLSVPDFRVPGLHHRLPPGGGVRGPAQGVAAAGSQEPFSVRRATGFQEPILRERELPLFLRGRGLGHLRRRKAKVYPVRVLRSPKSTFKDDYSPGTPGEFVLPLSQY